MNNEDITRMYRLLGNGKLLICSCDLLMQQELPEAKQLLASLLGYMDSDSFDPNVKVQFSTLEKMFIVAE